MKQLFVLLLVSLTLMSAKNPDTEGIEFFKGSFTSAKIKAEKEGKLFFLDFTASWCTPCRWMEETTFTDPILAAYVKENYIALQVDIDDFDGYALKQEYNIKILPSLLIFSSKGKLLGQYEESLSPTTMMNILKKYDAPENRIASQPTATNHYNIPQKSQPTSQPNQEVKLSSTIMVNSSNSKISTVDYSSNNPVAVTGITRNRLVKKEKRLVSFHEPDTKDRPTLHTLPSTINTSNNNTSTIEEETTFTSETFEKPNSHLSSVDPYGDTGEGLYRFKVHRQNSKGYSVQVGAYAEYGNVLKQSSMMQQHFDAPLIVHISKNRNRTLYKLMLGEFDTRTDAIDFMRTVQAKGLDCMVKDLSIH